jgi:hypothetical protein
LRLFADLAVELRMVVCINAALKGLRGVGSVKELRRDAQCTDPVAVAPGGTNLVSFANAWRPGICELPMI